VDRWEVRSDTKVVLGGGPNWLQAVGSSAHELGLDPKSLRRLVCVIENEGFVRIRDPKTGLRLTVRRLTSDAPLAEPMAGPAPHIAEAEPTSSEVAAAVEDTTLDDFLPGMAPPPQLTMLVPQLPAGDAITSARLAHLDEPPQAEVPESMAERLFDLGMDIASAPDLESASLLALEILSDVVPSESAAVLLADSTQNALRFSAATGPYAERARTLLVPLGVGIAGFAVATGRSIIVQDAESDPRRYAGADEATGYTTRSMLAAALVDADGQVLGCIELINPPEPFLDWHLDAACSIASALAEAVSIRGGGASPLD
jgi:hypothetical protein